MDKRSEIPCRCRLCKDPSCKFWYPPVCLNYKSESSLCLWRQMPFATKETPNKKSKKGGAKGSVAIIQEFIQLGCVSQDSCPRKSIQREPGKL